MATLEQLEVSLALNSAQLRAGLTAAQGDLDKFGKALESINSKLSGLSQANAFEIGKEAIKGLSEFVLKGSEAADQMGKMAQSAGEPVEAFSRMAFGANLSGVSTEELSKAMTRFNVNLAKAGSGVAAQSNLFTAMGVAVKDANGHVRDSDAVMKDLADKFAGMAAGASKSALAVEFFGKAGAALLPWLNEGAAGFERMAAEADRFGITITAEGAEATKALNENLERFDLISKAVATRVATDLAPNFTRLTTEMLNGQTGSASLKEAIQGIEIVIKALAAVAIFTAGVFEGLAASIGLAASAATLAAQGEFSRALEVFQAKDEQLKKIGESIKARVAALYTDGPLTKSETAAAKAPKTDGDAVLAKFEAGKKAAEEFKKAMEGLTKSVEQYQEQADVATENAAGGNWLDDIYVKLNTGKLADELRKVGAAGVKMKDDLIAAMTAIHDAALTKLSLKIDFDISKVQQGATEVARQRQAEFEGTNDPTKGFSSFNAALNEYSKQTVANTRLTGAASLLQLEQGERAGDGMLELAERAKVAADKADRAASAFDAIEKLELKNQSELGRTGAQTAETVNQRKIAFGQIGASPEDILKQQQGGFGSFDEALKAFAQQTQAHAVLLGEAETARAHKEEQLAQILTASADGAQLAADKASKAADAFLEQEQRDAASFSQVASTVASKLGDAGQIINAGIQGFASGGPIGAIVGVIAEIVSRMASFTKVLDYFNSNISEHIERLSRVFEPLFNILQQLSETVDSLSDAFPPIQWGFEALKGILFAIGKVFDLVAIGALSVAKAFADLGGGDQGLNAQLKKMQDDLAKPFDDNIGKLADLGTAATKVTNAFTAMTTNLPTGYKIGAANFAADNGTGGGLSASGKAAPLGTKNDPIYTTDAGTGEGAMTWDPVTGLGKSTSQGNGTNTYNPTTGNSTNRGDDDGVTNESTRPGQINSPGFNASGNAIAAPDATFWAAFAAAQAQGYDVQTAMAIAYQAQLNERGSSSGAATAVSSAGGGGIHQVGSSQPATTEFHFHGDLYPRDFNDFVKTITAKQDQQAGQRRPNPFVAKRRSG